MTKQKYYAVRIGAKTGIYSTWADCLQQVKGVSNAQFKSFTSLKDAQDYLNKDTILTYKPASAAILNDYEVVVHTDGGCRNHGNRAGGHVGKEDSAAWACLINNQINNKKYAATNGEFGRTNNYMEVRAVMRALQFMIKLGLNHKKILFVCDSRYALNASNADWLSEKSQNDFVMTNGDLWSHIYNLLNKYYTNNITWAWTYGHRGEEGNEYVDHLLNRTMDKLDLQKQDNNNQNQDK